MGLGKVQNQLSAALTARLQSQSQSQSNGGQVTYSRNSNPTGRSVLGVSPENFSPDPPLSPLSQGTTTVSPLSQYANRLAENGTQSSPEGRTDRKERNVSDPPIRASGPIVRFDSSDPQDIVKSTYAKKIQKSEILLPSAAASTEKLDEVPALREPSQGQAIGDTYGRRMSVASTGSVQQVRANRVLRDVTRLCAEGRHACLALVHGYVWRGDELYVVEEYSALGSLNDLLENPAIALSVEDLISIALDVSSACEYLHGLKKPLYHGNLRPSAVLLDAKLGAKLAWRGPPTATHWTMEEMTRRGPASSVANMDDISIHSARVSMSESERPSIVPRRGRRTSTVSARQATAAGDVHDFGYLLLRMFFPSK